MIVDRAKLTGGKGESEPSRIFNRSRVCVKRTKAVEETRSYRHLIHGIGISENKTTAGLKTEPGVGTSIIIAIVPCHGRRWLSNA